MNLAGPPAREALFGIPARSISTAITADVRVASDRVTPSIPVLQNLCHHIQEYAPDRDIYRELAQIWFDN